MYFFHHDTLPMGEFAIATNTNDLSYGRGVYDIAAKMPILIAEKTGPHFAVGDTCYTYDEDNMTYNPDGKAIIARTIQFPSAEKRIYQRHISTATRISQYHMMSLEPLQLFDTMAQHVI